jgi:protein tyrosine phosphatase (PTP) superfamily phosphohydrolase (DUF442 family)
MPLTPPADPTDIFMWRRVDHRLTTSGQPSEPQLARIAPLGVTHVLNLGLHTHEKALPDEAASVRALGMTYIHIPVDFDRPLEADLERFYGVMHDLSDTALHVHCIANLRVSAFFYRYHRDKAGMAQSEARARMERVWRPGGVWAVFVGDPARKDQPHQVAGRDY